MRRPDGITAGQRRGASGARDLNELKARGVEDVLIVVCDGLTGLPRGDHRGIASSEGADLISRHWAAAGVALRAP